ncbi:hypothetical protein, partial [Nocardia rhamnosiphila]
MDAQAEQLYEGANAFEVQKWTVIGFAVILAWTLLHAAVMFAYGGALEAYVATMRTRTVLGIASRRLLEYFAGMSARAAAERGVVALSVKAGVIGAVQGGGINLAVQWKQVAYEQRGEVAWKEVKTAAVAGGFGGGAGVVAGKWVGDRWVVPATVARAELADTVGKRVGVQLGGALLTGGAGGLVGGIVGTGVAVAMSGEKFTLEAFTESLLPAVAGGFLGAAGHSLASLRAAGPAPGAGGSSGVGVPSGPEPGGLVGSMGRPLTEALVAHGPLRGVDPDAVPKSHQQKLNELLSGLLRDVDTDVRQVNSVDWQPKGISLPENVGPVKVDSLAPRSGSAPAAEGHGAGAGIEPGQSVRPGAEPQPARVDSGGGPGPQSAGELHARLLQRLAGEESAGEPSAIAPGEPAASKGAIVNELPGGRGSLTEGAVEKPEKSAGVVAGEVNTSGGRDVRAGALQPEAAGRPVSAHGDDAGAVAGRAEGSPENPVTSGKPEAVRPTAVGGEEVVAAGRSANSPEAPATPRQSGVDGVVVREPPVGAVKASESSAPVRNAPEATSAKAPGETQAKAPGDTKPAVNRADAVGKPPGYPDRAVSADASGAASKPPVVKPEAQGSDIAGDATVQPSAETSAKSSVSAEEPGRAAEDGSPPRFDAESADDSGVRAGERNSESGDGQDGPAAGVGSEGADLAARYLREAHEVLARHAATDWSLVSREGFDWMIRQSGDGRESAAAMVEIIRRGDPKHRVLRWTQVMAVLVARDGGVGNMQAGEGKTLVFLAAAALKSAQGGPVKVITTRDVLANEAFGEYNAILGEYGFDIVRMNPDSPYADPVEGRPTIYVGTMNDAGFGELRGNVAPA